MAEDREENLVAAPVLSTPAENIFEDPTPAPPQQSFETRSDDELYEIYEIARTTHEIKQNGWKRIALQFPDSMLRDVGWVVEALDKALAESNEQPSNVTMIESTEKKQEKERIYVLADTSYSACCVDEVAAEHADAHVVVHYGRSCLSPTSRTPVIHVFTKHKLDHDAAAAAFEKEFPDKDNARVIFMADLTYQDHVAPLATILRSRGYKNLLHTEVVHDPSGTIPNRKVCTSDAGPAAEPDTKPDISETTAPQTSEPSVAEGTIAAIDLHEYSLFHISTPPAALLLALQTRLASLHVLNTPSSSSSAPSTDDPTRTTAALLRRRYARVLNVASAGVIGILVNTLSVANYLTGIDTLRKRIADAGKKSYTIVVGKLNTAKLANFSEIDGWVVVGCWESGLVEEDSGFFKPVITPFEMEAALVPDSERVWGLDWWAGMEKMRIGEKEGEGEVETVLGGGGALGADTEEAVVEVEGGVEGEESAPPEFDWRTGKLISTSRPMQVVVNGHKKVSRGGDADGNAADETAKSSDALIKAQAAGELATVNGVLSPGAEYLRSKRTWQGLGTDYDPEETSTVVEEGRSGVARGYTVGEDSSRT